MRVMISQPMSGVPDEEVKKVQTELKQRFAKYHIDVVDSFLTEEVEGSAHPGVYYLGRTLTKFMHDIDAVYFVDGWRNARGCRIERAICREYGIMILDSGFFRHEEEAQIRYFADGEEITPRVDYSNISKGLKPAFGEDIREHIPQIPRTEFNNGMECE